MIYFSSLPAIYLLPKNNKITTNTKKNFLYSLVSFPIDNCLLKHENLVWKFKHKNLVLNEFIKGQIYPERPFPFFRLTSNVFSDIGSVALIKKKNPKKRHKKSRDRSPNI